MVVHYESKHRLHPLELLHARIEMADGKSQMANEKGHFDDLLHKIMNVWQLVLR